MRRIFPAFVGGPGAVGLLLVRLVTGAAFVLHGWGKFQHPDGALGWMGPTAPVPGLLQAMAVFAELGGGAGLILGLATPLWCLLLAGTMGVAINFHAGMGHGFVATGPGQPSFELAAAYLANVLMLLLAGPGKLSVDAILFRK